MTRNRAKGRVQLAGRQLPRLADWTEPARRVASLMVSLDGLENAEHRVGRIERGGAGGAALRLGHHRGSMAGGQGTCRSRSRSARAQSCPQTGPTATADNLNLEISNVSTAPGSHSAHRQPSYDLFRDLYAGPDSRSHAGSHPHPIRSLVKEASGKCCLIKINDNCRCVSQLHSSNIGGFDGLESD